MAKDVYLHVHRPTIKKLITGTLFTASYLTPDSNVGSRWPLTSKIQTWITRKSDVDHIICLKYIGLFTETFTKRNPNMFLKIQSIAGCPLWSVRRRERQIFRMRWEVNYQLSISIQLGGENERETLTASHISAKVQGSN